MWKFLSRIILNRRLSVISAVVLLTLVMGYWAKNVKIAYQIPNLLPKSDATNIRYEAFKNMFGIDGNVAFITFQDTQVFNIERFTAYYNLTESLLQIEGVKRVVSITHTQTIHKNQKEKRFEFGPVISKIPDSQSELDSLKEVIFGLPFYEGLLYNTKRDVHTYAITLHDDKLDNLERNVLINKVKSHIGKFAQEQQIEVHYSGLPVLRSYMSSRLIKEVRLFIALALLVTAIILFLLFRSFQVVIISMILVAIGVIWAFGFVGLLGFNVTILTGLLPPLIIVIGVPNSVYLINKYHNELKLHSNKLKALQVSIQKIGNIALITNVTTALGFGTFILTKSSILVEFGIVATLNILSLFVISIILIPVLLSLFPTAKPKHIKHLENKFFNKVLMYFEYAILYKKKIIFGFFGVLIFMSIWGANYMSTSGSLIDDIPKDDTVYADLLFLESKFNGVMPFEVVIDAKVKNGAIRLSTLKKIEQLQDTLHSYGKISRSFSLADVVKFSRQAFYNGYQKWYSLPTQQELSFIMSYARNSDDNNQMSNLFVDTNNRVTRISAQVADIGTDEMKKLSEKLMPIIDEIFPPEKYEVYLTGSSIVFLESTGYLIRNLLLSLSLAIVLISLLMALMLKSPLMVFITVLTNLVPLVFTAGVMGWAAIPAKPSTILIFSIAFGISVDDSIHFLAKFRQELKLHSWNIRDAVINALQEVGISMIYTSIILFSGFSIFIASYFGSTVALGTLVSITLFIAMLANLLLLPAMLVIFSQLSIKKYFKDPFAIAHYEDEYIELEKLTK